MLTHQADRPANLRAAGAPLRLRCGDYIWQDALDTAMRGLNRNKRHLVKCLRGEWCLLQEASGVLEGDRPHPHKLPGRLWAEEFVALRGTYDVDKRSLFLPNRGCS